MVLPRFCSGTISPAVPAACGVYSAPTPSITRRMMRRLVDSGAQAGMEGQRHMFHAHACTRGAAPRKGRDAGLFVIAVMRFIDLMPLMPRRLCARCLAVKK